MSESIEQGPIAYKHKEKFTTIDDILVTAGRLYKDLITISQRKQPLDIRRGVSDMNIERESETVKAQGRTYFFDLESTKEGKPYLRITESYINKQDNEPKRNTILVFQDDIHEFTQAMTKMAYKVGKGFKPNR